MDSEKPIQAADAQKPRSWWSARRVWVVFIFLFAVIFTVSWWLTAIKPYATLNLRHECGPLLFSPNGTMLVTSSKKDFWRSAGPLRVWDVSSGQEKYSLAHSWNAIETVHFSPNSDLLAAHEMAGDLKIWNTRTGDEVTGIKPETKFGNWVNFRFSPDGSYLVFQDYSKGWANHKDYITFWNIQSKQEQGSVESYFGTLAFAPDGQLFATFRRKDYGQANEVLLWKIDQIPVLVKQHPITASRVAFSPDLQTFATADDLPDGNGLITMGDMLTGGKRWSVSFKEHGTRLQSLFFTPNGKILAAYGERGTPLDLGWRTTLWDVTSTPNEIGSFSETPTVSPDGEWLAVPLNTGAKLIKVLSPDRGADLTVNGDISCLAIGGWPTPSFSPDSKMILVKGLYRPGQEPLFGNWLPKNFNPFRGDPGGPVVCVWDTDSRRELLEVGQCSEACFSPDGLVLATLRESKAIDLWKVPFRASLWQAFSMAFILWMMAVSICWLAVKTRKKRLRKPAVANVPEK